MVSKELLVGKPMLSSAPVSLEQNDQLLAIRAPRTQVKLSLQHPLVGLPIQSQDLLGVLPVMDRLST